MMKNTIFLIIFTFTINCICSKKEYHPVVKYGPSSFFLGWSLPDFIKTYKQNSKNKTKYLENLKNAKQFQGNTDPLSQKIARLLKSPHHKSFLWNLQTYGIEAFGIRSFLLGLYKTSIAALLYLPYKQIKTIKEIRDEK